MAITLIFIKTIEKFLKHYQSEGSWMNNNDESSLIIITNERKVYLYLNQKAKFNL